MSTRIIDLWRRGRVMRQAFCEQVECVRAVHAEAAELVQSPLGTPPEFRVSLRPVRRSAYTLRRNVFSTLFYSMYFLLDIAEPRRRLYGKLTHLFRIWVTSADNLLDREYKAVLPLRMGGQSRVMEHVIAVMTADRILQRILARAAADGVIIRFGDDPDGGVPQGRRAGPVRGVPHRVPRQGGRGEGHALRRAEGRDAPSPEHRVGHQLRPRQARVKLGIASPVHSGILAADGCDGEGPEGDLG